MTIPTGTTPTERPTWLRSGMWIGGFVAFLYVVEIVDRILPADLQSAGIEARTSDGLWGILFAPILHGEWTHLTANTVPALVLGFLVLLSSGITRGLVATGVIWVVAGVGTWLFAGSGDNHIGASSLIFGWLTYLIIRGIFTRKGGQIVLGLVVLFFYGGMLWGVLPSNPLVSWQGHLFGAIGGVVAAWLLASDARRARAVKAADPLR